MLILDVKPGVSRISGTGHKVRVDIVSDNWQKKETKEGDKPVPGLTFGHVTEGQKHHVWVGS